MPHTLLLADDSKTIQRVVSLMFAGEDIKVVTVNDGDEAVQAFDRLSPDILLADVDMPGRNGYELAEYARRTPATSRVPVLLLAGAFDPVDQDRATACGAAGVLTKPFDTPSTIARVKELLGMESPSTVPTPAVADAPSPAATEVRRSESSAPAATTVPSAVAEVDRYFEHLDAAFTALGQGPRPVVREPEEAVAADDTAESEATSVSPPAPTAAPAPLAITDAFAALLAAEQAGIVPTSVSAVRLGSAQQRIDIDDLAEQVANRVLARLTDRVVRETVGEIVTATAERLVREEIERIKRNIP